MKVCLLIRGCKSLQQTLSKPIANPVYAYFKTYISLLQTTSPNLYLAKYKLGEAKYKLGEAKYKLYLVEGNGLLAVLCRTDNSFVPY